MKSAWNVLFVMNEFRHKQTCLKHINRKNRLFREVSKTDHLTFTPSSWHAITSGSVFALRSARFSLFFPLPPRCNFTLMKSSTVKLAPRIAAAVGLLNNFKSDLYAHLPSTNVSWSEQSLMWLWVFIPPEGLALRATSPSRAGQMILCRVY